MLVDLSGVAGDVILVPSLEGNTLVEHPRVGVDKGGRRRRWFLRGRG